MKMEPVGFMEKFLSPMAFLPWIPILLIAIILILWVIDKFVFRKFDIRPQLLKGNIAVAIVVVGVIWAITSIFSRAAFGSTEYDRIFRRATITYVGDKYDWRQFKAQGMTESRLNPHVCSSVGACGIMQFMPATARQFRIDPFRPREAIWAGIKYDMQLTRQWKAERPPWHRLALAFASYNAGLGNVLEFQRLAGGANLWNEIAPFAWKEPRQYIERIERWCIRYGGWGCSPDETKTAWWRWW